MMDTEKRLRLLRATTAAADMLDEARDVFCKMVDTAFADDDPSAPVNRDAAMLGFEALVRSVFATAPNPDSRRVDSVLASEIAAAVEEVVDRHGTMAPAATPTKGKGGRPRGSTSRKRADTSGDVDGVTANGHHIPLDSGNI